MDQGLGQNCTSFSSSSTKVICAYYKFNAPMHMLIIVNMEGRYCIIFAALFKVTMNCHSPPCPLLEQYTIQVSTVGP